MLHSGLSIHIPDWTCPACGAVEKTRPDSWLRDLLYRRAHERRCATAEGFVPSEKTVREAWKALDGRAAPPWVYFSTRNGHGYYGRAVLHRNGRRECVVSLRCAPAITMGTLVHELCHFAVGFEDHRGHDETFNRALRRAARRLWGLELNHEARGMHLSHLLDITLCANEIV